METTEAEKRRKKTEAQRRYRARLIKRAASGDDKAAKQRKKTKVKNMLYTTKTYIKEYANKKDISDFRDLIAARVQQLNKKAKK